MKTVMNAFIYLLVVLTFFLYVGKAITDLTGGERKERNEAVEITAAGGETIFWGRGRCFTCHSVGDEGSNVRGPNLGVFGTKFREPIGLRAAIRAKGRSGEMEKKYSATDYLIESLTDPGAYLVEGYKDEMAKVFAPPIALSLDEIKAVILYLQSLGGEPNREALDNPGEVSKKYYLKIAAASAAGGGDPGKGAIVFEDNCKVCHPMKGEGGRLGPDLSDIGEEGVKSIAASIQRPAESIAEGFETYIVTNKKGRQFVGVKTGGDSEEVEITGANGEVLTLEKGEIGEIKEAPNRSVMPEDFMDALTVREYQDLLAYLLLQKGQK